MTVTVFYEPAAAVKNDERTYSFDFPAVGPEAIEVYEQNFEGVAVLVRNQDMTIRFRNDPLSPIKTGGTVEFNRPHRPGTYQVTIARNTLITQTVDFPPQIGRFSPRAVEFVLDKMTMICQEIAERKCVDTDLISYPISQEINFTDYDDMKASVVNFALDKLTQIMIEIKANSEDCRVGVPDPETPA